MNIVLIEPGERRGPGCACVAGRKAEHLRDVLGKAAGAQLRVGELGGSLGVATIERVDDDGAWLRYEVSEPPPSPSPISLVVALPRPPMLRRLLHGVATLGVKRIALIHSARVEKSFWTSHSLRPEAVGEQLRLGLEQAGDTVPPSVGLFERFLPFVEDVLPAWAPPGPRLLADLTPEAESLAPAEQPTTLAIGPEGGWVDFERERWADAGFAPVALGPRVLRVEVATIAAVARLNPQISG